MTNFKDLSKLPAELLKQWRALSSRSRVGIVLGTVLLLAVLAYSGLSTSHLDYAPLYAGLSSEDAAAVLDKLRESKTPYVLSRNGETIEIPRDKIDETRITLAGSGLPRGNGVGFELFDKQGLGVSEFSQNVNFKRALQGELERSIGSLAAVQRARVHLVMPEKSLFNTGEQHATASVVLQLRAGKSLMPTQVQGIVHLVASSVEGLSPERVTVLDGRGEVLSQNNGKEALANATLTYQREIENKYRTAAQDLLEKTVGHGHAAVQVSARVDSTQAERTREEYDPEQQVARSQQATEETVGAAAEGAGGVAGARGNLPGGPPPQVSPGAGVMKKSTLTNFEIGKNTSKVTDPGGRIERLTIAVLVDGNYGPTPAGKGHEKEHKFIPRTQQELDSFAAIVREAVGFDEKRGDQIEVRCVPFAIGPEGDPLDMTDVKDLFPPWAYALLGAALLAMGAALLHILRRRREVQTLLPMGMQLPRSLKQIEEGLRSPRLADTKALPESSEEQDRTMLAAQKARERAVELIAAHPERAVQVLRAWINQTHPQVENHAITQSEETQSVVERS